MGYSDKKGFGWGTFMETIMLLSPAYQSLGVRNSVDGEGCVSGASIHILNVLLLLRQFKGKKDKKGANTQRMRVDDNEFILTYKQLENRPFNLTRSKITRGFDELLAKGFIEIVRQGGAFDKDKSIYALADDYLHWKPGDPPLRTRKKDVKRGFQGQGLGAVKQNQHAPT